MRKCAERPQVRLGLLDAAQRVVRDRRTAEIQFRQHEKRLELFETRIRD